jgi:membrane-associated protease RseP (regulator of RpoE activity)
MSVHETYQPIDMRGLAAAIGLNLVWVNISEVFRYFAFVMPMMRESLAMVPDVAPMNVPVFLIWGIWDTIVILAITAGAWLCFERFGYSRKIAVLAGTSVWLAIFVVLWLGLLNMNLATIGVLLVALPLAWLEMVVAALVTLWSLRRTRAAGRPRYQR